MVDFVKFSPNIQKTLLTSHSKVAASLILQGLGVDHVNDWTNHIGRVPDINKIISYNLWNKEGRKTMKI